MNHLLYYFFRDEFTVIEKASIYINGFMIVFAGVLAQASLEESPQRALLYLLACVLLGITTIRCRRW